LLFLNNNLHAVHHDRPWLAWYQIPAVYRRRRRDVLDGNGNYLIEGYSRLFARYLFRPKEPVAHPLNTPGARH
ncbi:MAG: fatty acid desaturase, partial [Hyphomicrobiales bacterium]